MDLTEKDLNYLFLIDSIFPNMQNALIGTLSYELDNYRLVRENVWVLSLEVNEEEWTMVETLDTLGIFIYFLDVVQPFHTEDPVHKRLLNILKQLKQLEEENLKRSPRLTRRKEES